MSSLQVGSLRLLSSIALTVFLVYSGSSMAQAAETETSTEADDSGFSVVVQKENDGGFFSPGAGSSPPPAVEVPTADPAPEAPVDGVPYCADDATGEIDPECVSGTADVCEPDEVLMWWPEPVDQDPAEVPNVVADSCAPIDVDRAVITSEAAPDPVDHPDLVAQEFRRLESPRPTIALQDEVEDQASPGKMWGVSMIGEYANMWTESPDHTLSTTLLGTEVTIRATPLEYIWDYGDGQSRKTATAGGPLRSGAAGTQTATSHAYQETGFYPVAVTTTYTGQFKTPTSGWIPIPGVATVSSPVKTATVWKSETRLVSGDCSEAPGSWGCETVPFPWEGGPQTSEAFKAAQEELEARQ